MLKISRLALSALFAPAALLAAAAGPPAGLVSVVVRDISVLDPSASRWLPHQDIVITDTTITSITPAGAPLPPAKTTINGAAKFAIPGLFDNRVALARWTRATAGLLVANGVTSIRDTGSDPALVAEWRRDIAYGKFMGPRIVSTCQAPAGDCTARVETSPRARHDELARLVREAGMTPPEALRAATIDSARLHGRAGDLGTLEAGKIADMLILNGDPLADIRHTTAIDAVIFRGEPLTRAHLNVLIGRGAAAAGAKR